jgi:hypothetical protein
MTKRPFGNNWRPGDVDADMDTLEEPVSLEDIQEALEWLAGQGLIFDTGRRRLSRLTGRYEIVWAAVPTGKKLN